MKTALILGISGRFGGHVAQALRERGYRLRALLRDPARLPAEFAGIEVVPGDVADLEALARAAEGMEVMVYGVNPPKYHWDGTAEPWLDKAATVAERRGMTLVFPGNVYVLDPALGAEQDESVPLKPLSRLGQTRLAMEQRLLEASRRGAQVILVRAGDFIGRGAPLAWINLLIKRRRRGYTLLTPGPRALPHTWAYLPDLAASAAELVERRSGLPAFNSFHFRGYRASFDDLASAIAEASGAPVRVRRFGWWLFRLLTPFDAMFRGLLDMRYLWQRPLLLDDTRLQQALQGRVPATPLAVALREAGLV